MSQRSSETSIHQRVKQKVADDEELNATPTAKKPLQVVQILRNRWISVGVFVLACLCTGALYYGWQQYAQMLFEAGAYSWLCEPGDVMPCEAQNNAVQTLYSIAAGCEYASAALGGVFLDHLGPRRSAMIGEAMWVVGTLMLIFSSQSAQMYIPAMIIIGSSINVVCFPSLSTIETFPAWKGLMIGVVLAAQQANTGIAPILYAIMTHHQVTFRSIWLVYIAAIWLPVSLLYFLTLPSAHDFEKLLRLQRIEVLAKKEIQKAYELGTSPPKPPLSPATSTIEAYTASSDVYRDVSAPSIHLQKASWHQFAKNCVVPDMLMMGVYFMIMMMMYAYYPTVVREAISPDISDFVAYAMPSQAVWALFVGFFCDYFSTAVVMMSMCISLGIVFALSMFPSVAWLQYLSACILIISQSAIFEVKYTYVCEMFDPYNFGKLVGFLGVLGGCGTFLNIPISHQPQYKRVFGVYIAIMPLLFATAIVLRLRQMRGVTYKSLPDEVPTPSSPLINHDASP